MDCTTAILVFAALDAGIPVLYEKPLVGMGDDSRVIVAKANETGILCPIAQNYQYTPMAQND